MFLYYRVFERSTNPEYDGPGHFISAFFNQKLAKEVAETLKLTIRHPGTFYEVVECLAVDQPCQYIAYSDHIDDKYLFSMNKVMADQSLLFRVATIINFLFNEDVQKAKKIVNENLLGFNKGILTMVTDILQPYFNGTAGKPLVEDPKKYDMSIEGALTYPYPINAKNNVRVYLLEGARDSLAMTCEKLANTIREHLKGYSFFTPFGFKDRHTVFANFFDAFKEMEPEYSDRLVGMLTTKELNLVRKNEILSGLSEERRHLILNGSVK